jgi:hypothetical protein
MRRVEALLAGALLLLAGLSGTLPATAAEACMGENCLSQEAAPQTDCVGEQCSAPVEQADPPAMECLGDGCAQRAGGPVEECSGQDCVLKPVEPNAD